MAPKADDDTQPLAVVSSNFGAEPMARSIPARFEDIVRRYPDRLAVKMAGQELTYEQLNRAANRIAWAIFERRGEAKESVALLFDHGIEAIVALLGALKAGKFYVVLEHSNPSLRLGHILEESQSALLLTSKQHLGLARQLEAEDSCILDIDDLDGSRRSENLNLAIAPGDFANIIYTSGSTGEPKGVVATHLNILDSHMVNPDAITILPNDRLSLLHSLSFHAAHGHLFQSLLNGASLFPFDVKSVGAHRLAEWLRVEQITMCHLPNSVFRQLAETLSGQTALPSLRLIHLSGAPMTALDFHLYKDKFSCETQFEVSMGSTETTGICSAVIDRNFSFPLEGSPVGYPRRNKKVLLLDENGQVVLPGQVGEIAVKTRNMKPGYWRRPELTKVKFRYGSPGDDEGIYLTGDLGKMLPDGFLIHLGRKDSLVKIRGNRIDVGEIEKPLLAHPQLADAGVIPREREDGEAYLAAYVVARSEPGPTVDELRRYLGEKLPDFMMPGSFVFMKSLPSVNGKLNRKELPRPDGRRPTLKQPYVEPMTEVERQLVQIWEEVLGVRPIGIHDNFFDLGGHSLAATRVVTRVLKKFKSDLPVNTLFHSPAIAEMALVVAAHSWKQLDEEALQEVLDELDSLSDDEAKNLAAKHGSGMSKK